MQVSSLKNPEISSRNSSSAISSIPSFPSIHSKFATPRKEPDHVA